jgi:2-dehydropantoate 2-reductase
MRILVVGAGATGGYFGGRLLQAGRDVTFLVRAARAAELARDGLVIRSPHGDATLPAPATVLAERLDRPFDLIVLACKAYDLEAAIASFAPAVGPDSAVLPLLNGMRHLDLLDGRFGRARVLGGQCVIAATLDEKRAIVHLNDVHSVTFGERDSGSSERVRAIAGAMNGAAFDARLSENIVLEMWEKWVFLATLAASTCLMRAAVGDIGAAPGGSAFMLALFEECRAVAQAQGFAPRPAMLERSRAGLLAAGSPFTASMLRDIERNAPIEADHIIGDLIRRAEAAGAPGPAASSPVPLLRLAFTQLKAYEARRARQAQVSPLSR